jgi:hypothetical protein
MRERIGKLLSRFGVAERRESVVLKVKPKTWSRYMTGLPNASVRTLQLLPALNLLADGSYGRGVFGIVTTGAPTAKLSLSAPHED